MAPLYVVLVRHSERRDCASPAWLATAARPHDSPLTSLGRSVAEHCGRELFHHFIARLLRPNDPSDDNNNRDKEDDPDAEHRGVKDPQSHEDTEVRENVELLPPASSSSSSLSLSPALNDRIEVVSSPLLRCVETADSVAAGIEAGHLHRLQTHSYSRRDEEALHCRSNSEDDLRQQSMLDQSSRGRTTTSCRDPKVITTSQDRLFVSLAPVLCEEPAWIHSDLRGRFLKVTPKNLPTSICLPPEALTASAIRVAIHSDASALPTPSSAPEDRHMGGENSSPNDKQAKCVRNVDTRFASQLQRRLPHFTVAHDAPQYSTLLEDTAAHGFQSTAERCCAVVHEILLHHSGLQHERRSAPGTSEQPDGEKVDEKIIILVGHGGVLDGIARGLGVLNGRVLQGEAGAASGNAGDPHESSASSGSSDSKMKSDGAANSAANDTACASRESAAYNACLGDASMMAAVAAAFEDEDYCPPYTGVCILKIDREFGISDDSNEPNGELHQEQPHGTPHYDQEGRDSEGKRQEDQTTVRGKDGASTSRLSVQRVPFMADSNGGGDEEGHTFALRAPHLTSTPGLDTAAWY